ncbi:hypothetical protein [Flavobacterium cellulosilyticum]|uniref:Lipoprotein n=1 Tax=Flavobacterium cellulosilyticum TaxID=2541731 RepID=A0A4R5C706_9FLAO|nr:hypothetical protein [Flavobacterium cellulosilyticum]TDD94865.1 hypothetical protein E0F76_15195 [Flavobacterium cellulosilyticum]
MKKLGLFCFLLVCFVFISCKKTKTIDADKLQNEKPINTNCYQAIYEKDTINLEVNTLKDGKISGEMVMKLENMPPKIGKIIGEFRGDTLFADYSFHQGANENKIFKNPIAILKRGNEFNLGNGKIENYLGASYFVKGEPVDFDNVKYKFTSIDCVVTE